MKANPDAHRIVGKGTLGKPQQAPVSPRMDVIELHPVCANGTLLAFASVKIGGQLVIGDLRIIKESGAKIVVAMSTATWVDREGHTRRRPLVVLPPRWSAVVATAVVAAWNRRQEKPDDVTPHEVTEKGGVA